MARVSREQSEKHREKIVEAAASLFRERGLNGVSVAELMAAAGLTHGGFYGHFTSKDELAAEACNLAFEESNRRLARRIASAGHQSLALEKVVGGYLGKDHRDGKGPICAAAALVSDVVREETDKPIHRTFASGLDDMVASLAGLFVEEGKDGRKMALSALATMVGAMLLARATRGEPISDEILAAAQSALLERKGSAEE